MKETQPLSVEQRRRLEADRADLMGAIQRGEYEAGADEQIQAIDAMLKVSSER